MSTSDFYNRHLLFLNPIWIDQLKNHGDVYVLNALNAWSSESRINESLKDIQLDTHMLVTILTYEITISGATTIAIHPFYNQWHTKIDQTTTINQLCELQHEIIMWFMNLFQSNIVRSENVLVNRILNYVHIHIETQLSVRKIASSLNYSVSHISHVFSKYMPISLSNYIQHQKISYADRLLEQGMAVSEVAQTLGYFDSSHFIKRYKRIHGHSPLSRLS